MILPSILAVLALVAPVHVQTPPAASPSPSPSPSPQASPTRPASPAATSRGARDKDKDAKTKRPPVYTNQDLINRGGTTEADPSSGESSGTGGTVTVLGRSDEAPADDLDAPRAAPADDLDAPRPDATRTRAYWKAKAEERRTAISDAQRTIEERERRVSELRSDLNPTNLGDPNREQTRQAEIAKAQGELEAARTALADARKALSDLEEEARRKSVPPGWLR